MRGEQELDRFTVQLTRAVPEHEIHSVAESVATAIKLPAPSVARALASGPGKNLTKPSSEAVVARLTAALVAAGAPAIAVRLPRPAPPPTQTPPPEPAIPDSVAPARHEQNQAPERHAAATRQRRPPGEAERWPPPTPARSTRVDRRRKRLRRINATWITIIAVVIIALLVVILGSNNANPATSEPVTTAGTQSSAPELVPVTIVSDPPGAQVFIGGRPIGPTPVVAEVPANQAISYLLVASEPSSDYDLYRTFEGSLEVSKADSISVWIERTTAEEQKRQIEAAEARRAMAADYTLAVFEDVSVRARSRPLSTYSAAELEALPMNRKFRAAVVLPAITSTQIGPTVERIVGDLTAADPELDELFVQLYSDADLIGSSGLDLGTITWAPEGVLGNVTPTIARSNDRSRYRLEYDVRKDLEEYLAQRSREETRFGLTEAQRRQLFKDVVAAEDRAMLEADQRYPLTAPNPDVEANSSLYRSLADQYRQDVLEARGATLDQWREIASEAFAEGWPPD